VHRAKNLGIEVVKQIAAIDHDHEKQQQVTQCNTPTKGMQGEKVTYARKNHGETLKDEGNANNMKIKDAAR